MRDIRLGVVGVGWIGEMRALTAAASPYVSEIHLAEVRSEAGERVAHETKASSLTCDYRDLLARVDAVIVSSAPETTHYPIARDCLGAGKHVLLEKPMALTLAEADELLGLARTAGVKFAVGYTQRFSPRYAYVRRALEEGILGDPVTLLISRHLTRVLGTKISGRGKLGPAQMEATHDIDLALWWLSKARPARVYAQSVGRVMTDEYGLPDCTWIMVTMEDGVVFTIGANWNLPQEDPGFSTTTLEIVGTKGAVFIDDSHRDLLLSTVEGGLVRPLSSMPGERVGHVFRGPLEDETRHFIECVALDRPCLVSGIEARRVMEVTLAAEASADSGIPVRVPLAGRPN